MINMTVNGVPQDPTFYQTSVPGAYAFNANAFANGQVVDTRVSMQSITPHGIGGHITTVVTADAPNAASVSAAWGGNGNATCSAVISGGQIIETVDATVGPDGNTGGDCQATWVPIVVPPPPPPPPPPPCTVDCTPPPPPVTCPSPLIGVPPDCMQPPPPPPTCTINCTPPPPPSQAPVPMPTLSDSAEVFMGLLIVAIGACYINRR